MGLLCTLQGCSHMETADRKVYAVTNRATGSTTYYRVRIESSAWNGKSRYAVGLYPSYAVARFTGEDQTLGSETANAEEDMRKAVVQAQKAALEEYLKAVASSGGKKELDAAAQRLCGVQTLPQPRIGSGDSSAVMDFNPLQNLVDHTANKQLVIALSSNPNAILDQISALAEEPQTVKQVSQVVTRLSLAAQRPENAELAERKAAMLRLADSIEADLNGITAEPGKAPDAAAIRVLISKVRQRIRMAQ